MVYIYTDGHASFQKCTMSIDRSEIFFSLVYLQGTEHSLMKQLGVGDPK